MVGRRRTENLSESFLRHVEYYDGQRTVDSAGEYESGGVIKLSCDNVWRADW